MNQLINVTLKVNGTEVSRPVEPRTHLIDFLRNELALTGSHAGCEHGVCGACTVLVDGEIVRGCLTLACQLDGADVVTVEGLTESGAIADLQTAFHLRNALQCGYCTPGMLVAATAILGQQPPATREEIREHLSGNYCRCTGYEAIVDAIEETAKARAAGRALAQEGA
ncbi:MAG: (2Fe-2S)-binding protein [Burkholderiales bacterium]|nr:(2Fe-2S)-binding protein [Burkholderiales bacterium]